MWKLLFIATLLLSTFASAQTMGNNLGDTESATNDWYNQKLAAQVQIYNRLAAATSPSITSPAPFGSQNTQPESMASNMGSQSAKDDWYNQQLAAAVQVYNRVYAATTPSATYSSQ